MTGQSQLAQRRHRETARLILQPWDGTHMASFVALCSDPIAMQFITGGSPISPDDARRLSERSVGLWHEHGFGPWAAIHKESGGWVGRIGLNLLPWWPGEDKWEIGFELAPAFWGQGLATEGAREALRFAFDELGLERVISVTRPDHVASRRVMENCGLTMRGEQALPSRARVVWYALDRRDYERRH